MSTALYLTVMLSAVALLIAAILPALLFTKCPKCGTRNLLDREDCRKCGQPLPEDPGV